MDGHDLVGRHLLVGGLELAGGRLRGRWQPADGPKLFVEGLRRQLGAILECLLADAYHQRHDFDAQLGGPFKREIGRAVGDDGDHGWQL